MHGYDIHEALYLHCDIHDPWISPILKDTRVYPKVMLQGDEVMKIFVFQFDILTLEPFL